MCPSSSSFGCWQLPEISILVFGRDVFYLRAILRCCITGWKLVQRLVQSIVLGLEMAYQKIEDRVRLQKEMAKKAVGLAMNNRWSEAVSINKAILDNSPNDIEALNRMAKAYMELGCNTEAKAAFNRVIEVAPHNPIARKNIGRLGQLGDEAPRQRVVSNKTVHGFIAETGKSVVTNLVNLGSSKTRAKMSPGDEVELKLETSHLKVGDVTNGTHLGQVEPRLAARLKRLIGGGNRYTATITSANDSELAIIIREAYRSPSQAHILSFTSKDSSSLSRVGPRNDAFISVDDEPGLGDEDSSFAERVTESKDWSNDDTEPGDDDIFATSVRRIVGATGMGSTAEQVL